MYHKAPPLPDLTLIPLAPVVGLLLLFALGVVVHVAFQARRQKLPLRESLSTAASMAWGLPALAVLVWLALEAAPHLRDRQNDETYQIGIAVAGPGIEHGASLPAAAQEGQLIAEAEDSNASGPPPKWINESPETAGDNKRLVVKSLQYATLEEAWQDALSAARKLVQKDFERSHQMTSANRSFYVPAGVVADSAVASRYDEEIVRDFGTFTAPMYRVYLQVELSPDVDAKIEPLWQSNLVQHRLWLLGGLLGLATLMLGTVATYFRLDVLTDGMYRWRLKAAAAALIAAGGLVTSAVLHAV